MRNTMLARLGLVLLLTGCVAPTDPEPDAGQDAALDAGHDAGGDAAQDADPDAGFDGGADSGTDPDQDSGGDEARDADRDGAGDDGLDAGIDGGTDAGGDTGATDEDPQQACGQTVFSYNAAGQGEAPGSVLLAGDFTAWGAGALPMADDDADGIWTRTVLLESGLHQYKFIVDDTWKLDSTNSEVMDDGGGNWNHFLQVDCDAHLEVLSHSSAQATGSLQASLRLQPAGIVLNPASVSVSLDHQAVSSGVSTTGNDILVSLTGLADGIHDVRVSAASQDGLVAKPVLLKFHLGVSTDWRDDVLYFVMTDRFYNGDPSNDAAFGTDALNDYQGGDLAGIRQKIEAGYFEDLGVNAIWITWPADNVDICEPGGKATSLDCNAQQPSDLSYTSTCYSAYHGYWPVSLDATEARFGTMNELQALVIAAHAHGIRVLLDYTANHVHTASAFFQEHKYDYFNHPDDGNAWICADHDWAEAVAEDCWFTGYLADIDYRKPGAVKAMVDMGLTWIQQTGVDGFRIDAVKHVNKAFLYELRRRLKAEVELTGIDFYLVGETFDGASKIKEYIGPDLLHGQFDFPSLWQILMGFATREVGLDAMNSAVRNTIFDYGAAAIMSTFLGNHDIARFISVANGDIWCGIYGSWKNGAQSWIAPPSAPGSAAPYERLRLAFTYVLTIPGVPLIYYGDEFGMPGAGDPDNRRMMRFGNDLNANEQALLAFMKKLGHLRADTAALRTGEWGAPLWANADVLVYPRSLGSQVALVALNRSDNGQALSVAVAALGVADGTQFVDGLADAPASLGVSGGNLSFTLPAHSAMILVKQ